MAADWIRRRFLLGWMVMAVSAGVAACDSPTSVAPRSEGGSPELLVAPATETEAPVVVADSETTSALFNTDCTINNGCATTGTVTVAEPGGNATIGTYGAPWVTTITVGADTYKYQLGLVNGSFIGIIFKNGVFAGYWGYCLFPNAQNNWYKSTDAAGKTYIHWENHELDSNRNDTGQMYHYIYDPSTNTLKVYHRKKDGTTVLVYQGPPIKSHGKLPPPDPAAGAGPYTNENQWTTGVPVPAVPAAPTGTGTTNPSTTTPSTATPMTGGTMSMSVGLSFAAADGGHLSRSGAPAGNR